MPITPNGTAYTVYSASVPGHGTCYWTVADSVADDANLPTILYAHGSGGAANQWATLPAANSMRDAWIDGGGLVIEGGGGSTDTAGAQNWGNAESRTAYIAYLNYVSNILSLGDLAVVGRSMGGLVASWLATRSSIAPQVDAYVNLSGVTTMLVGSSDGSAPVIDKNTVRHFGSILWNAYGQSSYDGAAAAVNGEYSPEDWDPSVWAGKNILAVYGDNDTSVPWNTRGGGPLDATWFAQAADYRPVLRPNGDHGGNSTWLNVSDVISFLADHTSFTPFVPPEVPRRSALGWFKLVSGKHHKMSTVDNF